MQLERISPEFERALEDARQFAERRGDAFITLSHVLYVMLDRGGALRPFADKQGAQCGPLLDVLMARATEERQGWGLDPGKRPIAGNALRAIIDEAFGVADRRGAALVQPADLLTAALEGGDDALRARLREAGLSADAVRKAADAHAAVGEVLGRKATPGAGSLLERFGRDLCAMARQGKFMPVIGRDEEIRAVIHTLLRKTKNNPVLVGDAGTGKTAIVEGLAQRIVAGDVADSLKGCRAVALDLAALVAGAKYRGEFEERLTGLVDEVRARQGEIILFLDELHTLVGAGGSAGGLDAANILKPALARGELRCIGATTYDEYRERIEKDAALARRFERVVVEEPDDEATLNILRGIRPHYEAHHGVRLSDASLTAAVKLSRRYLRDRFLPDNATASVQSPEDVDLFDTRGTPIRTLVGPDHPGAVALAGEFHPVEDTIAIIYALGGGPYPGELPEGVPEVVVFDAKDGTAVRHFDLNAGASEVSFSPSGRWLAVSSGPVVHVFDWNEGVEVSRLISPADVGHPYFLDDNRVLVPVERYGFATYTIDDGRLVNERPVPSLSLITAADTNRSRLAYRAGDRIGVVDLSTGTVVFDLRAPWVIALALDPDGSRLAYSGFDSNIYVVPMEGDGPGLELAGTLANVHALNFVDSQRLLSYGEDALLWDVSPAGPDQLGAIDLAEAQWGFQVSDDMSLLSYYVSAGLGGDPSGDPADGMRLVDLVSGDETLVVEQEVMTIKAGYRQVSTDFTMVGSLTQGGVSTVRRLPSWEVIRQFEDCRSPIALTPDNSHVLLTGWVCAGTAPAEGPAESEVVEMDSGEPILTIPYQTIWSAAFSPAGFSDAGRYLIATDQLTVEVWDLLERESIRSFAASELGNVGGQMLLAFDPTGRYVVGGTTAGTVWVLDMERVVSGAEMVDAIVFSRQAHAGAAPGPALSADGIVATAGFDGMVRLWDLDSEDLLLEFEAEMGTPVVRFTPDGTHLLYPHRGSIRRIPVNTHALRGLAAQLLTRDLLPDECSRYARQERCDALEG